MARMKSPGQVLGSVSSSLDQAKPWIILGIAGYALYSFRGVFSALGGGAGDLVSGAVAKVQADANDKIEKVKADAASKSDRTKVQAATGKKVSYTDAQLATFRQDAATLVEMLGQGELGARTVFKDQQGAFTLIKSKYSRLNLHNNKPWKKGFDSFANPVMISQTVETGDSEKNKTNYKVLIPFYKEITNGRDLVADFRYWVTGTDRTKYFKWIL